MLGYIDPRAAAAVLEALAGSAASECSAAVACWRALRSGTLTPFAAAAFAASTAFSIKAAVSTSEVAMAAGGAVFFLARPGLSCSEMERLRLTPGEPGAWGASAASGAAGA